MFSGGRPPIGARSYPSGRRPELDLVPRRHAGRHPSGGHRRFGSNTRGRMIQLFAVIDRLGKIIALIKFLIVDSIVARGHGEATWPESSPPTDSVIGATS